VLKRAKTVHALDRAATVISLVIFKHVYYFSACILVFINVENIFLTFIARKDILWPLKVILNNCIYNGLYIKTEEFRTCI
jgi:hypothetical protein